MRENTVSSAVSVAAAIIPLIAVTSSPIPPRIASAFSIKTYLPAPETSNQAVLPPLTVTVAVPLLKVMGVTGLIAVSAAPVAVSLMYFVPAAAPRVSPKVYPSAVTVASSIRRY